MNDEEMSQAIIGLVAEISNQEVERDTALLDDEIIDSFGMLAIINFLEEELSIEIDPADLSGSEFTSVDTIVQWGRSLVEKSA